MQEKTTDLLPALSKQLPPWAIVAADLLAGIPLERWVLILTLLYTLLQMFVLVRDKVLKKTAIKAEATDD